MPFCSFHRLLRLVSLIGRCFFCFLIIQNSHVVAAPAAGNGDGSRFSLLDHMCSSSVQEQLLDLAQQGHEGAQYYVGAMLFDGVCGEMDEAQGLAWMLAAAERGFIDAQHDYGRLSLAVADTDEQRHEALYWLGAAAGQGDALSALALAYLHEAGMHGLNQNVCLALDWYAASEALGNDDMASHAQELRAAQPSC